MDNKNATLSNRPKAFDDVHVQFVSNAYISNECLKDEIVFASTASWGKLLHSWIILKLKKCWPILLLILGLKSFIWWSLEHCQALM